MTSLSADSLRRAASNGNDAVIVQCLRSGVPIDSADKDGRTALLLACYHGRELCVRALCAARPPPNLNIQATSYWRGRTALMMACGHGYAACVAALFDSGLPIDLDLRDANLQSAYQLCATSELKGMLRRYRETTMAQEEERRRTAEAEEAQRRAIADAAAAQRENEVRAAAAELEALLAAKREADEVKRRHAAELGFLKTELDQTLFQLCEAKLAHETCDADIKTATTQRDQYHSELKTATEKITSLDTQLSLVKAEKSAALESLRLTTDKCGAYKTRVEALVHDVEQARLAAAAFALAAQARENELRGERDRALSEADSLREALSAIKDERRALLHDTGQFAHTHANVLKTLSDECEAARHDRDRARADCAAALVQVEATKTETRRMVDAAEAKAAAALAERDAARQTAHAAAAEKAAALEACEIAHAEKRAAQSARDEALRLKGEADARAALEVIAREFATKERERVEAAMDRVRERAEADMDKFRERSEQAADRARAREETATAHLEERERTYATRWQEADLRADAAENRAVKAEHTIAEMTEDARRAEVARAQMAVDAAALSGERDQLQARLADVDKALIRARDEGEAAAAKAALDIHSLRDELAAARRDVESMQTKHEAAVAAAREADESHALAMASASAAAQQALSECESRVSALSNRCDEAEAAALRSETARVDASNAAALELETVKAALVGAERRAAAVTSDNARAHAEWAGTPSKRGLGLGLGTPQRSGSTTPSLVVQGSARLGFTHASAPAPLANGVVNDAKATTTTATTTTA